MRDTVIKPGDTYKVFLRNDTIFPHAEVLSIDDNWIEFAVLQRDGSFVFETYPKDIIKKMQYPEDLDKKVWVLMNDEEEAKFTLSDQIFSFFIIITEIKNFTICKISKEQICECCTGVREGFWMILRTVKTRCENY